MKTVCALTMLVATLSFAGVQGQTQGPAVARLRPFDKLGPS